MFETSIASVLDVTARNLAALARQRRRAGDGRALAQTLSPQLRADVGLSPNGELVADEVAPRRNDRRA